MFGVRFLSAGRSLTRPVAAISAGAAGAGFAFYSPARSEARPAFHSEGLDDDKAPRARSFLRSSLMPMVSSPPIETATTKAKTVLVMSGDCGGTNTRLQIFRIPEGSKNELGHEPPGELVFAKKYLNKYHDSFEATCQTFLSEASPKCGGLKPKTCCLACAGGIINNSVTFTNVSGGWTIDGTSLQESLGIPKVKIINDFEAQGYGLLTLQDSEKTRLNDASPRPGAPIACIGAGTGLGECYLTPDSKGRYTCWPCEGGHVEFSPRGPLQLDMLHFLKEKFGHKLRISVERVVSGTGLANIYGFMRQHWAFEGEVDKGIDEQYEVSEDQGRVVAEASYRGDKVACKCVDIFSECYGSEAGCVALKYLPYGGLYVSGGIAAKNPSWVNNSHFLSAYKDKGRLSYCVESVPVYLVTTEDTGERGALYIAVQLLSDDP